MITIKDIAFTGYPVTDIVRARAFYEGVLGLKAGVIFEHGGSHGIEYDIGSTTLAISNMSADTWKPSSDVPSVALEVADFDAAIAHLREYRVPFVLEPMDNGVCRMAMIADPDGNSLAVHRRAA